MVLSKPVRSRRQNGESCFHSRFLLSLHGLYAYCSPLVLYHREIRIPVVVVVVVAVVVVVVVDGDDDDDDDDDDVVVVVVVVVDDVVVDDGGSNVDLLG